MKHQRIVRWLIPLVFGLMLPGTLTPAQTRETTVRATVRDEIKTPIGGVTVYVPAADVKNLARRPGDRIRNSAHDEAVHDRLAADRDRDRKGPADRNGRSEIEARMGARDAPPFNLILLLAVLGSYARAR